MVAFCGNYDTNAAFTAPTGWTSIRSYTLTGLRVQAYYKHVTTASSEPASYAFTGAQEVHLYVVYGHQSSSPIDDSAQGLKVANTTYVQWSGLAATLNGTLAIKMAGTAHNRATTNSPGTGWTARATTAQTFSATKAFDAGSVNGNGFDDYVIQLSTSGSTSGGIFVIIKPVVNGLVSPPTATATGSAETPTVSVVGNAVVVGALASASAESLAPTAVAAAQVAVTAMAAAAEMLAPSVTGAALVVAAEAAATGSGLAPELIYDGVVAATVADAAAALAEPMVAGGAVATATAMDAAMAMAAPVVSGAALLEAVAATATAEALAPLAIQSITSPLMTMTGAASSPDVRGGAALVAGLATASATVEAPGWGMAMAAPTLLASASGLSPGYVTGALVDIATAAMALGALTPEAGTRKYPARWRGGGASVAPVARQSTAARRGGIGVTVTGGTSETGTTSRRGGVGATVTGRATSGSVAEGEV